MSPNAQWAELAFTLPALFGLLVCWWAFHDAIADLHYLQARGLNGAREIVARASCRNEALRTVIQAMFTALGMALLMLPPANPHASMTRQSLIVSIVIITAELLLVTKSLLDRRDRHRVIAILSGEDHE